MNIRRKIAVQMLTMTVLLASISSSVQAKAHVRAYVRPAAQYVILVDKNISDSGHFGGGFAAGAVFGERERFEVGAEISRLQFNGYYKGKKDSTGLPRDNGTAAFRVTPLLVTFRYYFTDKDVFIRPYVGAVLGYTQSEVTFLGVSNTAGGLSAGMSCGLSFALGQRLALDTGYRYINSSDAVDGWFLDFSGNRFRYRAHILSLALNVRF